MMKELDKELEPVTYIPEVGFTSYVDPSSVGSQEEHDKKWSQLAGSTNTTGPLEIQYELPFDKEYWQSMASITSTLGTSLSVHAPIHDRDTACEDVQKREWSVEENMRSMDLANSIGAKVFILHLTPQDDFENREAQIERGLESFRELIQYKKAMGFGFKVLLETLEYPKWPSDIEETQDILEKAKAIDPEVGFCVDVAHLWHNVTTLHPNVQGNDFPAYLRNYLEAVEKISSVNRIHLGGAFVEETENGLSHETHRFPGLPPDIELDEDTVLFFDDKPEGFQGKWMEIDPVLRVISEFSREKYESEGEKPDIVVEIHDQDPRVQKLAAEKIKEQLEIISAPN